MLVLFLDISQKQKNMLKFIKPLPVIITLMTATGILMHDMHIDKATTIAVSVPSAYESAGNTAAYEKVISQNYHTHVERVSLPRNNAFRSSLPNMAPPRDDDRRYVQNKKLLFMGGGDTSSLWPSV